jgi:hypothetical protein
VKASLTPYSKQTDCTRHPVDAVRVDVLGSAKAVSSAFEKVVRSSSSTASRR